MPASQRLKEMCPSRKYFWGLYDKRGDWQSVVSSDLDDIIADICQRAGMRIFPDFYSLRHRFRSDMLIGGMPEYLINFLMGHETRGIESLNIYLERNLDDLVFQYTRTARPLIEKYGFVWNNHNG